MDQEEAERIAQSIRQSGLADMQVYGVKCVNHVTQDYQVECGYRGKTKRFENVQLEGSIRLWVKSPRHWMQLQRIIVDGTIVD